MCIPVLNVQGKQFLHIKTVQAHYHQGDKQYIHWNGSNFKDFDTKFLFWGQM